MDRTRIALEQMAREDPELAARLVLQTLPGAQVDGLSYDVVVEGLGRHHIGNGDESAEFELHTDPQGLAALAGGASPLGLMMRRRLRVTGNRRRALKLRELGDGDAPSIADAIAAGAPLDADAIYRALRYMIDPEWTRGHRFTVAYEVRGEGGGTWYVHIADGERPRITTDGDGEEPDARLEMAIYTYRRLVASEMTPAEAMR